MSAVECSHEQDVLDALASRRWPDRAGHALRAHVATCAICGDLAMVAGALLDADADGQVASKLPPASLVWWRAQLRAREEAARAALRPIRLAQFAACLCLGALLVAFLASVVPSVFAVFEATSAAVSRALASIPAIDIQTDAAASFAAGALANRGVQLAAAAWIILVPVAGYLAFSRE